MEQKIYDIAVSYASEQRTYVERFVKRLQSHELHVYYDRDAQVKMVGKILDQELHKTYIQESKHCVLFLSNAYIEKPVTRYESQIIISEALYEYDFMYIFKFDNVTLPGLNRNFVYSSAQDYPEPEQYADFIYTVIKGKKPTDASEVGLYEIVVDGLKQILDRYASQYELNLKIDAQTNKVLLRLQSGRAVLLQLQAGKMPGKSGVCLWLHRGRYSCDNHAYQGYVEWAAQDCQYRLKNRGILLELTPELEFSSTDNLLKRLEEEIITLIGG